MLGQHMHRPLGSAHPPSCSTTEFLHDHMLLSVQLFAFIIWATIYIYIFLAINLSKTRTTYKCEINPVVLSY